MVAGSPPPPHFIHCLFLEAGVTAITQLSASPHKSRKSLISHHLVPPMSCLCSVCQRNLPQGDRAFCLQGAALSSDNHRHSPPIWSCNRLRGHYWQRETSLCPLHSYCIVEQTAEITSSAEFLLAAEQKTNPQWWKYLSCKCLYL